MTERQKQDLLVLIEQYGACCCLKGNRDGRGAGRQAREAAIEAGLKLGEIRVKLDRIQIHHRVTQEAAGLNRVVPAAPPVHTGDAPSWKDVCETVLGYALKFRTILLVEDGHTRSVIHMLATGGAGDIWSPVEQELAISQFRQRESARVLVIPFRDGYHGYDLSFASIGVIAVSAETAKDDARLRQAVGRFDRLGGSIREIRVLVVQEDT